MQTMKQQFNAFQVGTPTGFRGVSFRLNRNQLGQSGRESESGTVNMTGLNLDESNMLTDTPFAIEGTDRELRTNVLVHVPIRNFKAAVQKKRRNSLELVSLTNPVVIKQITEQAAQQPKEVP